MTGAAALVAALGALGCYQSYAEFTDAGLDGVAESDAAGPEVRDDGKFDSRIWLKTLPAHAQPGPQTVYVLAREIEDLVSRGGATWARGFLLLDPNEPSRPGPGLAVKPEPQCTEEIIFDPSTGTFTVVVTCDGVPAEENPMERDFLSADDESRH